MLLDAHLPARSMPRSRPYINIVYDVSTALVVAASSFMNRFASYDEDGKIVWEPDSACLYSVAILSKRCGAPDHAIFRLPLQVRISPIPTARPRRSSSFHPMDGSRWTGTRSCAVAKRVHCEHDVLMKGF